jgi:hypothetical protein
MNDQITPATVLPDAFQRKLPYDNRGMLTSPVPCCRCGYDLIGLHIQAVCPECSEPVARSAVGDLLELMPVERVARVHKLLGRVSLGTYLSALLPTLGSSAFFAIAAGAWGSGVTQAAPIVQSGINAIGLLVLLSGWSGLSRMGYGDAPTDRAASRAIWLLACGYVAWLLQPLLGALAVASQPQNQPQMIGLPGLFLLGGTSGIAQLVLFPVWIGFSAAYFWHAQNYLASVARRALDPLLEHRARSRRLSSVLWWTIGLLALMLGPLVAISNLTTSIKDCRFHTKRIIRDHKSRGESPA